MATLDHIGLNRYIYMSASSETMTLGSLANDVGGSDPVHKSITNPNSASILGSTLDDSRLLLGINLYNNGPYGYSSWQQTRMSHNPLSRHLRRNNQFPIVENGKERIVVSEGKRSVFLERHGNQLVLDEPAVVSSYKPINLFGTVDVYNQEGLPSSKRLVKKISLDNNSAYFTNTKINTISGLSEKTDEFYDILKNYYLEDNLNSADSPLSSFEKLVYSQTIYPPQQYTYKSYTRARTTFSFNWNSNIMNRQQENAFNNFGTRIEKSSVWPLDVDPNWVNFPTPLIQNLGIKSGSTHVLSTYFARSTVTSSFGILWNHYAQAAHRLQLIGQRSDPNPGFFHTANTFLKPAPIYSRRHTIHQSESVTAPTGRTELRPNVNFFEKIFGGEAYWDVPKQSGKYPFYDSYALFSDDTRTKAKDYTIVPEFRISDHVPQFLSSSVFQIPSNLLEISGGKENSANSSTQDFYKIYTNSDFLKNFDVVLRDHKDFTDPSRITIKCNAIKKLVPYDGFYPVQRTVNLAEQFFSSSRDNITLSTGSSHAPLYGLDDSQADHGFQNILGPLFAPGVLYNSIKSGIACDYPIITGSMQTATSAIVNVAGVIVALNGKITSNFDKRIPFEALLQPEKYLSDYTVYGNEPHNSSSLSSSAFWNGQGDELYSRMANNFLAEIPNFFLRNKTFTTLASLPQSDPNFGQTTIDKDVYTMRVKIYRSMDSSNNSVLSNAAALTTRYVPPQDIISSGRKETITMYSRPTAFGPPSKGTNTLSSGTTTVDPSLYDGAKVITDSTKGFNFPFTPPYYHGQAWADITFSPGNTNKKHTVSEILASSSVQYYRFDTDCWDATLPTGSNAVGPQALLNLNSNAMQLSASLNIFSKGIIGETNESTQQALANLNIQVDDQSRARWIIQPKFETPILNFKDYIDQNGHTSNVTLPTDTTVASQVPVGMWHQYGRIPTEREGIFLQVTDIPENWVKGRLGFGNLDRTGSLADLCGFSNNPVKLGSVANGKKIHECVVAIPFVQNRGVKEFFKLDPDMVDRVVAGQTDGEDITLIKLVKNIRDFVFPPTFDFVNFPGEVTPVAMYCFKFQHVLSQQDLIDIWQNVLPDIGRQHEEAQASISHSLIKNNTMIKKDNLREDLRWMVFKVKQRAAARYFDQVFTKKGDKTQEISSGDVEIDQSGPISKIQYNWPYDFFSLVELVKIDASIEFSDVETDDNGEERPRPRVAREQNRIRQLDTLFPRDEQ